MKADLVYGENTEMYLKTLSELAAEKDIVPVTDLAGRLGISTVSASEKVRRLQEQGFVKHVPYKGVTLTAGGRRRANAVLRRHRLWERFLVDHLDVDWQDAHEAACRLEHATDRAISERLAAYLNEPATCPHGNPIPDLKSSGNHDLGIRLTELDLPAEIFVLRVFPESAQLLSDIVRLGLKPGTILRFRSVEPEGASVQLKDSKRNVTVPAEISKQLYVRRFDKVGA